MNSPKWLVALVLLVGLVGLSGVSAQEGGPPAGSLVAQETSQQKVQKIEAKYREKLQELKIKRNALKSKLAEQLSQPQPDRQQIMKTLDEWMGLEREEQHLTFDKALEILGVLEGDERARYLEKLIEGLLK